NSIRHNLYLNLLFRKKNRPITEPGKGHYWYIDISINNLHRLSINGFTPLLCRCKQRIVHTALACPSIHCVKCFSTTRADTECQCVVCAEAGLVIIGS
ncbi:hypothetical protein BDQ17DRAFT_1248813, partial [Cyathus striatus]